VPAISGTNMIARDAGSVAQTEQAPRARSHL
jgi:hypothetical protein